MPVVRTVVDEIVTLRLDDGKVNAIDGKLVAELREHLSIAASYRAVVLTGRPGVFTGGLDTKALAGMSTDELLSFFVEFGELILKLWVAPVPVVCAATGHAIAAGTLLALASDHVIAANGDFRWGMTEARIGLELSDYAIMLVRSRVTAGRADKLLLEGLMLDVPAAVAIGLADESTDEDRILERAMEVAGELAELPREVYSRNKARLRHDRARLALDTLRADVERFRPVQDPQRDHHV